MTATHEWLHLMQYRSKTEEITTAVLRTSSVTVCSLRVAAAAATVAAMLQFPASYAVPLCLLSYYVGVGGTVTIKTLSLTMT